VYPNLKLQLWKSGIRQNRLARVLGVDETVLSRIVNGFREPNPALRQSIAAALKCEADWLFATEHEEIPVAIVGETTMAGTTTRSSSPAK
jgi:transcriptional regulator with XRE-family HTH domain